MKNKDVTVDIALKQIEEVMCMEKVTPVCNLCGVHMYKSSMCNGMSHCGIEKCYVCGRTTPVGGHLELIHWDQTGDRGCPRYDNHQFWQTLPQKFLCVETKCYGDNLDCTIKSHQPGIKAMHNERKVWYAWGMIRSLVDDKRIEVMEKMKSTKSNDEQRNLIIRRLQASIDRG